MTMHYAAVATAMLLAALALLAFPAHAVSEDAMEVQRCIWRCMHDDNSLGRAYRSCVASKCNDGPKRTRRKRRP